MSANNRLYILWTNDNVITAENMVFMYATNALVHGWWEEVTLIIWGATAKLVCENTAIQGKIREALEAGVRCFNVESTAELEVLSEVATQMGRTARVSLRVNPDVDAGTHPYISTGLKGNKFGVAHEVAVATYQRAAQLPGIEVVGIDCHIGSQITEIAPYLDALDRVLDLVEAIEATGVTLHHLDLGGGLGEEERVLGEEVVHAGVSGGSWGYGWAANDTARNHSARASATA